MAIGDAGPRENKMVVVSGLQGIGKSNETMLQIQEYITSPHARKVLILDPNNEFGSYELYDRAGTFLRVINVPILDPDDIERFNNQTVIEIRRIVVFDKYGQPLSDEEQDALAVKVCKTFRRGVLFIDDLNKIFGDSIPQKFAALLINVRHRGVDLILSVQSIGRILPKMWQNTKIVRFHRQLDDIEDSKDKISRNRCEIFTLAELIVKHQHDEEGNRRFFLYIDLEAMKLKGISKNMFERATVEYLELNSGIVKKEFNRIDLTSFKKTTSLGDAVQKQKDLLYKKYFPAPIK